jgi:hypothetical protein
MPIRALVILEDGEAVDEHWHQSGEMAVFQRDNISVPVRRLRVKSNIVNDMTYAIYAEPMLLGHHIRQVHVKNGDRLLETPGGRLEWPRMAQELYDIGYRGWYVLETSSPTSDVVADTRANIEYVRRTFRIPPPPDSSGG